MSQELILIHLTIGILYKYINIYIYIYSIYMSGLWGTKFHTAHAAHSAHTAHAAHDAQLNQLKD